MPEVAEVRLIADNLDRFLTGKYLKLFRVINPVVLVKWINRNCPGLSLLNEKLDDLPEGLLVKGVRTRGKFCWIECDYDISIGISFGMSGNIRPEPTPEFLAVYRWKEKTISKEEYLKHCHIAIEFEDSRSNKEIIYYHDIRRFGRFDIYYGKAELDKKLAKLGHDPLSEAGLEDVEILSKFRSLNHQNICKVLMEQGLIAGVGNFIKSETLYEARINPHSLTKNIPDNALLQLYTAIKKIAKDDYESGGCALYTFSGMNGDQNDFKETLKVYGREGLRNENGFVIKRIPEALSPDRRSTFWVPEIQTIGLLMSLPIGVPVEPIPVLPLPIVIRPRVHLKIIKLPIRQQVAKVAKAPEVPEAST